MIKDIKLGIGMMRNSLTYEHSIFACLLALGVGIVFAFLLPVPALSGLYIAIGCMGYVQQIYFISVSTLVQSSPYKKKFRTTIPAYITLFAMLIANTLCLVMHWLSYLRVRNNESIYLMSMEYDSKTYANTMVICALLMVGILLYMVLANVLFFPATIVLVGMWIWWKFSIGTIDLAYWDISIGMGILLSYVVVFAGAFILYIVNCLTYKLEYSKLSYQGPLKRASK